MNFVESRKKSWLQTMSYAMGSSQSLAMVSRVRSLESCRSLVVHALAEGEWRRANAFAREACGGCKFYVMGMADSERQTWNEQFNRIDRESDKLDARVCAASRRLVIAPCQDFDRERVECSYRFQ